MLTKRFIFFGLLFLFSTEVFACLSADQNRIFPMAWVGDNLLVMETHLSRSIARENSDRIGVKAVWGVTVHTVLYSQQNVPIEITFIEKNYNISNECVAAHLKEVFDRAFELVEECYDREEIRFLKKTSYYFAKNPKEIRLVLNKKKRSASFRYKGKSYAFNLLTPTAMEKHCFFYCKELDSKCFDFLEHRLRFHSVKEYQAGENRFIIVHFAYGDDRYVQERKPERAYFQELKQGIDHEKVLHHGHGVEMVFFEG